MDLEITDIRDLNPRHDGLAAAVKDETQKRMYIKFKHIHDELKSHVSYPPEGWDNPTYFFTDNALKALVTENTSLEQIEIVKVQIDMYKEALYETLASVKKELVSF